MLPEETTSLLIDGERVLPQGHSQALVASKSEEGSWHSVEWSDDEMCWTCTCISFQTRHKCRHAKAIDRWAGGIADVKYARDEEEDS